MRTRVALAFLAAVAIVLGGCVALAGAAPPNIVVITTDDQRWDTADLLPYVNGRDDWIRFERAYYNVPLCCPSRATILKGKYAHNTGVLRNADGSAFSDANTVATALDPVYKTALVGKYLNGYPWKKPGTYKPPGWNRWWAFKDKKGGLGYYNYTLVENGVSKTYGSGAAAYSTDVLAARAKGFIRNANPATPIFLWFNPYAPHDPKIPAPRHDGDFADRTVPLSPAFNEGDVSDKPAWVRQRTPVDRAEQERKWRDAAESLKAVDEAVEGIFAVLRNTGRLDNTVVFVMSDNGWSFGDHRWEKKTCVYEGCARMALWVRMPGRSDRTVPELVSNADLAPTIVDLAGVSSSIAFDGASLVDLLEGGSQPVRQDALLYGDGSPAEGLPKWWGVTDGRYKYVEIVGTGERELYDLQLDPWELDSKHADVAYGAVITKMAARLAALRTCTGASCR